MFPYFFPEMTQLLTLTKKFEFTPEGIAKRASATVDFYKGLKPRSPINRAFQQLI